MKQKLAKLKGGIDNSTTKVGSINTIFSIIIRKSRQKIHRTTKHLHNTLHQADLTDIYGTLRPAAME